MNMNHFVIYEYELFYYKRKKYSTSNDHYTIHRVYDRDSL